MIIAAYFVNFIVFSFMGWVWETVYCTFKTKHWQNRGFLYGPIYGTAAVTAMIVFNFVPVLNTGSLASWKIFLICAAGSAVIEYATSYVLEKIFHAVWWDYSTVPLNINGRICLPATYRDCPLSVSLHPFAPSGKQTAPERRPFTLFHVPFRDGPCADNRKPDRTDNKDGKLFS